MPSERVSIWQAGCHDNPFGQRLTARTISKQIPDASVPTSLLAAHLSVHLHLLPWQPRNVAAEMH